MNQINGDIPHRVWACLIHDEVPSAHFFETRAKAEAMLGQSPGEVVECEVRPTMKRRVHRPDIDAPNPVGPIANPDRQRDSSPTPPPDARMTAETHTPTGKLNAWEAAKLIDETCIVPGGTYTLPCLQMDKAAAIIRRVAPEPGGEGERALNEIAHHGCCGTCASIAAKALARLAAGGEQNG